ncbi:MAG: TetR/AcrR family transcriptional regulator [Ktedonobacteraceae bacterium]|nr:TetR/AcrR family transcriptional regulator [Ktedonobacteraceae bacterium]
MAVMTRRNWLEEGMAILEEMGVEALTIEMLTHRLGITKGSFYHHFRNYQHFKESLLTFYEEERTLQIIQLAERETSPQGKLERIMQATLQPSQLEVVMRSWALQDPLVRDYQQRIDQQRLTYLEELIFAHIDNHTHAKRMAQLFYSIYVGSQHIVPPIQSADLEHLYQEALQLLNVSSDIPSPEAVRKGEESL